jgi:hypothetical protein
MTPNRVVAVLTPLVFAPLAGAVAAWLAEHFPGFNVDQNALEEIFIAGALIALAPAAQWLHGWQKFEARQAELERDVAVAEATAPALAAAAVAEAVEDEEGVEETLTLEELGELDELAELEELAEMDELDAELLAEEEQPAASES